MYKTLLSLILIFALANHCNTASKADKTMINEQHELSTATFGAGCFWCVEAIFQRVKGVQLVESGYEGGTVAAPTYREVCNGTTGHAEVCRIQYDSTVVSYAELLEVFWKTHDPTTPNQQGADVGTQYRSVIFYHTEQQRIEAEGYLHKLTEARIWPASIVTQILPATDFYKAEDYHQNYYNSNTNEGYCNFVITPKVKKFEKVFQQLIR